MAEDLEFRSFMLQVSKEMSANDFAQLKYLLKGYVSNAKCEQITAVFHYFEELERMCLLSPTNFGVLKKALGAIDRQDLVEKLEQKEQYFANVFREKKMDSLGPKEYDAVCDGITKAAGKLGALHIPRSGHNTPELQKKLKLASLENEDLVQLEETLTISEMPSEMTELGKGKKTKKANDSPLKKEERPIYSRHPTEMRAGGDHEDEDKPSPYIDNAESMEIPLEEATASNSVEGAVAAKDHQPETKTAEHVLASVENVTISSTDQKEPSQDTVPDCNEMDDLNTGKAKHDIPEATTSLPATTLPSFSNHQKLEEDVVTDGKVNDKENVADSKKGEDNTTSKEAEHQAPQHSHGPGARPKEPLLKKAKTANPSEVAEQKATEQGDEVAETNPHGTLFAENIIEDYNTPYPETTSSKEPTEGAYSGPSTPTGDIFFSDGNESDELYDSDENKSTESLNEKPESITHGPGQGAGASASKGPSGCYHPPGISSSTASNQKASGYSGHAVPGDFSFPESIGGESTMHGPGQGATATASKGPLGCHHPPGVFSSTGTDQKAFSGHAAPDNFSLTELIAVASALGLHIQPTASEQPYHQQMAIMNQLLALQQSVSGAQGFNPSTISGPQSYSSTSSSQTAATVDSPLQSNCYSKAGYSVVITNGHLCESTSEKGVVIMESGTQFRIAIANDNDYAAEVDITFGGMFLGVWVVEAKQSLSSPLIIEGSSWAAGRLRFFSASDASKPQPSADIYGEQPALNGRIELEFKPEVKTMKIIAKHVRQEELFEISIIDSKTTTVSDLKQEIRKKWNSDISYLIKGDEVLQEGKTISSYVLNENEVIEVLHAQEELKIETAGRDPVIMMVDPRDVSVEAVKKFIAKEIKIQVDEQVLRFKGKDIHVDVDTESLNQMLMTSKQVPVLKVDKDRNINVKVALPNRGGEVKIEINLSATVDDLKEKLKEREICDPSVRFKFRDQEISGQGSKKLIDLGFKNQSEITVLETKRGTHRGFSSSAFDGGSRTRGFGGFRGLGLDDYVSATSPFRGSPSGTRTLRNGPGDVELDSSGCHDEEGIALLYGNEKNVHEDFQFDKTGQQFSKEKAVTLVIQLKAKSMGATGAAAAAPSHSSVPSGAHYSGGPTGPMSTPTPPPVPE